MNSISKNSKKLDDYEKLNVAKVNLKMKTRTIL